MRCLMFFILAGAFLFADEDPTAIIIPHQSLKEYSLNGNWLKGVATPTLGAKQFEIWRTSWAVGCYTPPHRHETEEIFIFLKGKGKVVIGGKETYFEAPCTIICPANVEHQFFNTGDEPTDAVAVMGPHSQIFDHEDCPMRLPWRN